MNKSTIVAGVHPWFPKCIPEKCIPALKSIGQAGWTLGEDFKVDGDTAKHYITNKRLTVEEQQVSRQLATPFQVTVSMILANGPKIFVIPADLIDNLDKVEISIKVKDFAMPFPAIIVKNKQEYHFVVQLEDQIMLGVASGANEVDYLAMHKKEETIESYLSQNTITWTHGTDVLNDESEIIPNGFQHRFRATLNFIAMLMMGGFKKTKLSDSAKRRKYATGVARSTKPDEYESQTSICGAQH